MKINELTNLASHKTTKRKGRGISAGQGKTAGRGTKGQKARAGSTKKPGFAGGQNPLMQQLPKLPGFRSYHEKAENVFTDQLERVKADTITAKELASKGLISNEFVKVKLLFRGDLSKAYTVKLPLASKTALDAIEKAGGSFVKSNRISREKLAKNKKEAK